MKTITISLIFFLLAAFLVVPAISVAQGLGQHKNKFVRKLQKTVWTAGISGVVIDDDAKAFNNLFNVKDSWNLLPFFSKATLEAHIDRGFCIESSFSYMQLKKVKIGLDQDQHYNEIIPLFTGDLSLKYDLNYVLVNTGALSPYIIGGPGYTYRGFATNKNALTANIGIGSTIWVRRGIGINIQTVAKFALNHVTSKNYLMHSLGLVYRFNLIRGYITPDRLGYRHRY